MVKNSIHNNIRRNNLGQDAEAIEQLSQKIVKKGMDVVLAQKNIKRIVSDILEREEKLSKNKGMFITELSPTLMQMIIAYRSVYERNIRKDIFDQLIPLIISALNKELTSHNVKIKIKNKQSRDRYSSTTRVRLKKHK